MRSANHPARWYLVKVILKLTCNVGHQRNEYTEQWRLVNAPRKLAAAAKARRLVMQEGVPLLLAEGLQIQWKYSGVAAVVSLASHADGAELLSQTQRLQREG